MKCRSCSSVHLIDFCDLGQAPLSNGLIPECQLGQNEKRYPLKIKTCVECLLVQTQDFVEAHDIFTFDYVYFSSYSSTWIKHAEKFVQEVVKNYNLNHNNFVVEIASNDGYLLQFIKKSGIPCLGVEPAEDASAIAENKGINVINDFFSLKLSGEIVAKYGEADLVVANNVLAHVPDPVNILCGVYKLLKTTGVASVEFHSVKELIQRQAIDTIYHEHFSYYSLHSFKTLAESAHLKVVDVLELDSHGGSLRVFLTKDDSNHDVSNKVSDVIASEYEMGLADINTYRVFSENVIDIKHACINFLLNAKREGLKVAGYGAAAKASTLLNYAGITRNLIPFIADKSPSKVGKHIPGCRIPIVDVEKLIDFEPDYIIIFPWNIKNEVISELSPRLPKRVKFFQLVPEVVLLQ
ncbi:MAG: SAM-dependent methyltransferase [Gammaproteobacteria bacterium]|nr:SAM-dependent methyltransferase [Gammaproteobacteria bacterium]